MVHGHEKSDLAVVAVKPANKVASPVVEQSTMGPAAAESVERRVGTKGNSGRPCRSPATKKGRCRLHGGARCSGGPPGKQNGQYRHGERTKAAIAERQKFRALLKMLRAGLT